MKNTSGAADAMTLEEFAENAHRTVDWVVNFYQNITELPVKSTVKPGDVLGKLPDVPKSAGESFDQIMCDFEETIMPGMTHWQHPGFYAYFNGNASRPSLLAEMLTSALGAQCMKWETSPAAAELEERMMEWLRDAMGLPRDFIGSIQDTASTANLCAIICAREKVSDPSVNKAGLYQRAAMRVYCSAETHSSIEKAAGIAGIGRENVVKIDVDEEFAMRAALLETVIVRDIENGLTPCCIVATLGTTGSTAIDPLAELALIAKKYDIWLHVDAAWAGTALLLPEFRWMIEGIESADSFVFNPHKWMFTNFDCSVFYVRDRDQLIRTFSILPEYLKTGVDDQVNNYCDWGITLGRRFRALKLWFVIRSYGLDGLRSKIKYHIDIAQELASRMDAHPDFELMVKPKLNLICFRFAPAGIADPDTLNALNATFMQNLNQTGKMYLTHTKLSGKYTLRLCAGQTYLTREYLQNSWEIIQKVAQDLKTIRRQF